MNYPLVSVIMPSYNSKNTIQEAINSVLSQSYKNLELIIVDDSSLDDTLGFLNKEVNDSRVRIFSTPINKGVAAARNLALSYATGDYIAFIDSDDLWEKEKLELQIDCLKNTEYTICYTSYNFMDVDGNKLDKLYLVPESITYRDLLFQNVIGCSTVLLKSDILPKEPFDSRFFHEDYILWLKLLKLGNRAVGIRKPLTIYRLGGRSQNKFLSAYHRWKAYRGAENLSFAYSVYCMWHYFLSGITKGCKHFLL